MNSSLRWKLILAFVLVFFAGIACGFFGAFRGAPWMFGHPHHGSVAEHMKRHLRTELNLTAQQMEQISPIVDRAASQLEAKREQTMREVRSIFEETHRAITPFLTAEQQTKLGELEQRHHRRFHRRGFMRPPPPGPSP